MMRDGSVMVSRGTSGIRPRRWLPALLVAVPICALGHTSITTIPSAYATSASTGDDVVVIVQSPFSSALRAQALADRDDQDHHDTPRRWPRDNQGDGQRRWSTPEQHNRVDDRRRFETLPPQQQQRLIQTRERFLNLPPETRDRLRQRWQDMSPDERRRWREREPEPRRD